MDIRYGQICRGPKFSVIEAKSAIRCVRTFSDDGESDWVYAIIPGLGKCQVQRDELTFDLASSIETRPSTLKTLTISFNKEEDTYPRSNRVPQFLAEVGSQLKDLTIDGPRNEIDVNVIIRHCASLHKLSLCGGIIDVQLDLSDYRYSNTPVPELTCHWHDVRALAADLADTNNPLSKIVRRLRLRLNDKCKLWRRVAGGYDFDKLPGDMKAIGNMVSVNRHLAYLDVLVLTDHHNYGRSLKKQHLKPLALPAKLPLNLKLAFLSVVSSQAGPAEAQRNKRPRRSEGSANGLDQRVVSRIFAFAGPPLLRRVYFRTTKFYWEPYSNVWLDDDDDDDDDHADDDDDQF
ncbi:unnamed protein product [Phytophthora lilii]|uniref:Unnamed protein product n=1 Tax=Phytophthora lilii TaxID=2077276 RepID=A0A9W6X0L2_9STRA|nr:unnamed protein product [Phytophthora lilii]